MNPFATAAETAAAIRNNTISARELVENTFRRIDEIIQRSTRSSAICGLRRWRVPQTPTER